MNYLAHSYLAFSDGQIVGQFLQDYIRNSERFDYPLPLQQGIILHREVDTFTDAHPEIQQAKKIFSPVVRLYAGAFVDVAMDFFLARSLGPQALKRHTQKVYRALQHPPVPLPTKLNSMAAGMRRDNWLYRYSDTQGIAFSMQNVLHKAKHLDNDLPVLEVFLDHIPQLQAHFDVFFPEVLAHARRVDASFPK